MPTAVSFSGRFVNPGSTVTLIAVGDNPNGIVVRCLTLFVAKAPGGASMICKGKVLTSPGSLVVLTAGAPLAGAVSAGAGISQLQHPMFFPAGVALILLLSDSETGDMADADGFYERL